MKREAIHAVRSNLTYIISKEFGLTEENKKILVDLTKQSIQQNESFAQISKDIQGQIVEKDEFIRYSWVVMVTTPKAPKPCAYPYKTLIINFKELCVVIIGFIKILTQVSSRIELDFCYQCLCYCSRVLK